MAQIEKFYLPDELYYDSEDHLWLKMENEAVRIGMDQLGQETVGTILHISIPFTDKLIKRKNNFGHLEAGKYVGPLRMPLDGRIVEVNQKVQRQPDLVNQDPYGAGWLILVTPVNLAENLPGLLHGQEAISRWLAERVQDYRERGILPEEET